MKNEFIGDIKPFLAGFQHGGSRQRNLHRNNLGLHNCGGMFDPKTDNHIQTIRRRSQGHSALILLENCGDGAAKEPPDRHHRTGVPEPSDQIHGRAVERIELSDQSDRGEKRQCVLDWSEHVRVVVAC